MKKFAYSKPRSWAEAYIPLFAWAAVIFFLSSQQTLPGVDISILDFLAKKIGHMTVYAILYILAAKTTFFHTGAQYKKYWYIPLIVCFLYAVTDEYHQSFVPNRSPSPRDIGFDMLGTSIMFLKHHRYI